MIDVTKKMICVQRGMTYVPNEGNSIRTKYQKLVNGLRLGL